MIRKPRDYQLKLKTETAKAVMEHGRVCVQAPTGAGKSFIMSMIIDSGISKGKTFLVITESLKIFSQLSNEFNAYRINSDTKYFPVYPNKCYVAMSQSLKNRTKIIDQFKNLGKDLFLIIDEAHIGTTKNLINLFPDQYRLGFTATPAWRWAKFLPELYSYLVVGPQVQELIISGALSPYKHIGRKKVDQSKLKLDSSGDYSERSQEIAFGENVVYDGLYEDLHKVSYKKGMIYCASIKHAEQCYEKLLEHGFKASIYHSKRDDLKQQIEIFHNSDDTNLMVSVGTLTKGYDFPLIDLIVLYRKTTSLPLYLQMVGRGGRVLAGKTHFTVLDYGLNHDTFGSWDADRDWNKLWQPGKNSEGVAPVKECPKCEALLHSSARYCIYCDFIFPATEKQLEQGDLIDFNQEYTKLVGKKLSELNPYELSVYAINKQRIKFCIYIAKSKRYDQKKIDSKDTNYLQKFGQYMNYKPNWYMVQTGEIDKRLRKNDPYLFKDFILK